MAIVLFDNQYRKKLFPLTATKAVADLRVGILKIKDWWQSKTKQPVFIHTAAYLQGLYTEISIEEHFWIDASVLADDFLIQKILALATNECLADEFGLIAGKATIEQFNNTASLTYFETITNIENVQRFEWPQQLFQLNDWLIREHFKLITQERSSQPISSTNQTISLENIFIEAGASVEFSILNASTGPIYIGKNATILEGSIIRGPFALLENAAIKMGAKIYGATTIGVHSIAGGEIKNAILGDYSNKAHDGYLGDSVIGEWCNLGAGTSNSNIKNTAGDVKLWNDGTNNYESAGQKCGVIMGDYTKVAINSCINTGSNFGVGCNVFGEGLLPTLLQHFSWGTQLQNKYQFNKLVNDINNWKKLKGKVLSNQEIEVLKSLYNNFN